MSQPNQQITAAALKVDGVSDTDPDGRIPLEKLINGTVAIIPRWDRFPEAALPGVPEKYSILHFFWEQNNLETEFFTQRYTHVDDQPEFEIPLSPQLMSVDGTAFIRYDLEGYDGNPDPSPTKTLTIDHTVVPTFNKPRFPDANLWGYVYCKPLTPESPPVWEKIRVEILVETVFREFDEFVLEWQGFATLNGAPPELTILYQLRRSLSLEDAQRGFIYDVAFDPYVRPMFNNHSAVASYSILRNGVPVGRSHAGLIKIDRTIAGEDTPCGGFL